MNSIIVILSIVGMASAGNLLGAPIATYGAAPAYAQYGATVVSGPAVYSAPAVVKTHHAYAAPIYAPAPIVKTVAAAPIAYTAPVATYAAAPVATYATAPVLAKTFAAPAYAAPAYAAPAYASPAYASPAYAAPAYAPYGATTLL